jgi:hypothetical protein
MNAQCDQCLAITRELHDALAEILRDPKVKEFYSPFMEMVQGNRDLEETFEKFPQWRVGVASQPELTPLGRALRAAAVHQLLTGHKVFVKPPFRDR